MPEEPPSDDGRSHPARGRWSSTITTSLVIMLCGLATGVLTARLLLPEGRGLLAEVVFWPLFIAGFGSLSLNEAIALRVGQGTHARDELLSTGVWLALATAALTALLSLPFIGRLVGGEAAGHEGFVRMYLVLHLPFAFLGMNLLAIDQGDQRFLRFNLLRAAQPLLYLAGVLGLWAAGAASVRTLALASLAGTILVALLRLASAGRALFVPPTRRAADALLRQGLKFHAINVLYYASTQMDRLLLVLFASARDLGLYVVGFTVASASLGLAAQAAQIVALPTLAAERSEETVRRLLGESVRFSTLALVLLTLPLAAALPWLVPWLFGSEFEPAVWPSIALLVAFVPRAVRGVVSYSLRGLGVARPQVSSELVAILFFLPLFFVASTRLGLLGVALALGVANAAALVVLLLHVSRTYSLRPSELFGLDRRTLTELWTRARAELAR